MELLIRPPTLATIIIFYFLAFPNYFFNRVYIFAENVCEVFTYFSQGVEKKEEIELN